MMHQRNPFEVLCVTPLAERRAIRSAYRVLAKMYHPDTQQGLTREESHRRMIELNWARAELEKDLAGWRLRVPTGDGDEWRTLTGQTWREFTEEYRRPNGEPLGWRAWIGSDVVCNECGCYLSTWVHKCPDCGRDTWKRSKLYAVGSRLTFVSWILLFVMVPPAILFMLALLAIPPVLVLDSTGVLKDERGWPWEWTLKGQLLTGLGIAIEQGIIVGWKRLTRGRKKSNID